MKTNLFTTKAILLLSLFGCVSLQAQQTHEIIWSMETTTEEATITIEVGDTIKWVWGEEGMPHDVSSIDSNAPEDFGSTIMTALGSEYEYTFNEEVVFDYRCSVHPGMMFGTITVEDTASIETPFTVSLKYYPNPVRETFTVEALLPVQTYKIFDIQGKQIQEKTMDNNSSTISIDISSFENGIYFVEVLSVNQESSTFKIIKN